jgi:hypothetical protein
MFHLLWVLVHRQFVALPPSGDLFIRAKDLMLDLFIRAKDLMFEANRLRRERELMRALSAERDLSAPLN